MNIETTNQKITSATINSSTTTLSRSVNEDFSKFSDELTALSRQEKVEKTNKEELKTESQEKTDKTEEVKEEKKTEEKADKVEETKDESSKLNSQEKKEETEENKSENKPEDALVHDEKNKENGLDDVFNGLKNTLEEINKVKNPNNSFGNLDENNLEQIKKPEDFNHPDEKPVDIIKKPEFNTDKDKNNEENGLINNDMNIQESKEPVMPQMNSGMNFDTNGQPFREFMNNQQQELSLSQKDLEEETAILSTMSENIAIASKNMLLNKNTQKESEKVEPVQLEQNTETTQERVQPRVKTVSNEQGIKKVDTKTNVTVETVVKYDKVIMDAGDVEFFTKLVEQGSVDMNTAVQHTGKSAQVSKTLADMLAKSMQDNQPVRIDFDNNISVIIKISRQGKISADFLPSSQVAEAYLKENLPLLKQRFDDNNIEYDELNQRRQRQDEKEDRKKGRKDE